MDPSLMREIPTPTAEQASVTINDLSGSYLPIIQTQAQTIAALQGHVNALDRACREMGAQNRGLRLRVLELESGQRTADVAEEIAPKRNGKAADAVKV